MLQEQQSSHPSYDYDPPKKVAPADKRDALFLILTLFSLFLVVDFGFAAGMNLGFSIAYAALFATATAYLFVKGCLLPFPTLCGALSLALCPIFAIYHDTLGNTAAFFTLCLLFSIYIGGCTGVLYRGIGGFRLFYDCLRILCFYPLVHIASPFEGIKAARGESKKRGNLLGVILGLLAGIPVLCIVIPLLISSDAAFAAIIEMLFKSIGTTLLHLFFALLLTPPVYSVLYALRHKLTGKPSSSTGSARMIDNAVICGFLGLLSAVYLIYLFSQLAYFFSAFGSILPEEFSAADYARRGFFELCVISVINLILLFCSFTLVKKEEGADIRKSVKGFGIFLCLFNLVLVGTAISKMALYIGRFGLTRLRILTTLFMVMMGVLFLCLILRLIRRGFPYMAVSLIVCTLLGIGVLYADVNTVIASYNVNAYLSGNLSSIDLNMLDDLGASAVPALDRLAKQASDPTEQARTLAALNDIRDSVKPADDFRSYNFSKARALKILSGYEYSSPGNADGIFYTVDPKVVYTLPRERYCLLRNRDGSALLCEDLGNYRYKVLADGITGYCPDDDKGGYLAIRISEEKCYLFYTEAGRMTDPMDEEAIRKVWAGLHDRTGLYWREIY